MPDTCACRKWQSSEYFNSSRLAANIHVAYMGELALSRCCDSLHANGGPCPIIVVYRADLKLGALLHVDGGNAEIDGVNHEELIDQLLVMEGEIYNGAICHVFLDAIPAQQPPRSQVDVAEQVQTREKYGNKIKEYLELKQFHNVSVIFEGQGKSVVLDTENGILISKDDDKAITFKYDYNDSMRSG